MEISNNILAGIIIVGVALVLAGGFITPVISGFILSVTGVQESCLANPYNSECVCPVDTSKIPFPSFGFLPSWRCESVDTIIDPELPNEELYDEIQLMAINKIIEFQPDCQSAYCLDGSISGGIGYQPSGNRLLVAECSKPYTGGRTVWWELMVDLEDGTEFMSNCYK